MIQTCECLLISFGCPYTSMNNNIHSSLGNPRYRIFRGKVFIRLELIVWTRWVPGNVPRGEYRVVAYVLTTANCNRTNKLVNEFAWLNKSTSHANANRECKWNLKGRRDNQQAKKEVNQFYHFNLLETNETARADDERVFALINFIILPFLSSLVHPLWMNFFHQLILYLIKIIICHFWRIK